MNFKKQKKHSLLGFIGLIAISLMACLPVFLVAQEASNNNRLSKSSSALLQEVEAFLKIPSVAGREQEAAKFIRSRLGALPVKQDALGNLILVIGSGKPRRLFTAALDEPGYVVTRIQDDGYLRLNPVGSGNRGNLWHQFHEGQKVVIATENGLVPGALGVRSTHLRRGRRDSDEPFSLEDAYVDVGAESAEEVAALGIQLLDPVTLIKRPMLLRDKMIAALFAQTKAACVALVEAARRVARSETRGTTVFAWMVLETAGRKGLEHVVQSHGPFDEVFLASRNFGLAREGRELRRVEIPAPGSGVIAAGRIAESLAGTNATAHVEPFPASYTRGPDWGGAQVGYFGLPSRYQDTPVELVHVDDIQQLAAAFIRAAGGNTASDHVEMPELRSHASLREGGKGHERSAEVLGALIAEYGVSGAEAPVRQRVQSLLPSWAKPKTDEHGNLLFTFGQGKEHIAFVAHSDEVGFRVESILEDGRLQLQARGGLYPSLWEAQAALAHGSRGDVPGVFEPRADPYEADKRTPPGPLTVYVGAASRDEALAMGIEAGKSTVTMPKQMLRIGRHRVLARSFDDRVGSSALILAAEKIDPNKVKKRVTFAWVVEEEIGLVGSQALAKALKEVTRVYPVDTFVSSDAPLESDRFAHALLGKGAVIRAMDSSNLAPRSAIKKILDLAKTNAIAIQYGMTSGGNDGAPFLVQGAINVPLSWPGRYSHSPVEVADLRDLEALVELVRAIVMN
jgi:putative aminopeptidase FrvX